MSDTSVSLLDRLRDPADAVAWRRLVDLYEPLIRGWLARHGLQDSDRDDLAQELLTVLVRELPGFQHNRQRGAFRHWLRTITVNRLRAFGRAAQYRPLATGASDLTKVFDELEAPDSELSRLWDE